MSNNNDNLDFLLKLLSKGKKTPPKTASDEELSQYIMNSLNKNQSDTLKKLMNDPKAAEDFLKNPRAQEILNKLNKNNK